MLHSKQKLAMSLVENGYNVFITGNAGTGKSFLIRTMKRADPSLVITSTTGISALNVRGTTLHRWSGIQVDTDMNKPHAFVYSILNNYSKWNNYLYTSKLIIDEVSMLHPEMFEFLNKVCQIVRCCSKPFGGIQVILFGDFFQLPPVSDTTKFAFQSPVWNYAIDYTVNLTKCFRQNDTTLVQFLNKIRVGKLDEPMYNVISSCSNMKTGRQYTHLYPNKCNVLLKNTVELSKIQRPAVESVAEIIPKNPKSKVKYSFPDKTNIVEKLVLKPGCFIMINTNIDLDKGLVNGTQGIFEGFSNNRALIRTNTGRLCTLGKFSWDMKDFYVEQYPLCLAWAITIHKSQGMGIEYLSIDIGPNVFEDGQAYVALSRAISLDGLHVKDFHPSSIRCNKSVKKFYKELKQLERSWTVNSGPDSLYQNCLTGQLRKTLPKHGRVLESDPPHKKGVAPSFSRLLMNSYHPCTMCSNTYSNNEYAQWYKEYVCTNCIIDNPTQYRMMNRSDVYDKYYGRFTKTYLNKVLKQLNYRLNISKNRFHTKTKIYLHKHVEEHLFGTPVAKRSRQ